MKNLILSIQLIFITCLVSLAQNDVDALRYSINTFGGTARYMSMSGAFGALGADFSSLSSNPAGIGLYKKSEFTITPAFYVGETESSYYGNTHHDSQHNFNLSNVGFIFTSANGSKNDKSIVKSFQFGIGINRLNNFNNRILIEGYNNENSISDTYVDDANGIHFDDLENDYYGNYAYDLNLAWWTYLIDTVPGFIDQYTGAVPDGGGILQRKEIESWGSVNEFVMSFGASIGDRLYLGTTIGFPMLRYYKRETYYEIDEEDRIDDFNSIRIYEDLSTRGSGVNVKFGMIVRATNWFRFGGSIHSPTWYHNLRDNWYTEISTEFENDYFNERSPYGTYDYKLETPWRATGSVAFVLWRIALISGDYEYVDYSGSKLRGSDYNFFDENKTISFKYKEAHNVRLGAELRFGFVAFRAGYSIYGSPFSTYENGDPINDGERTNYSGGIGFRGENFFLDLAYVRSVSNENYYLYGSENISATPVENKYISNNFLMTLGFRY